MKFKSLLFFLLLSYATIGISQSLPKKPQKAPNTSDTTQSKQTSIEKGNSKNVHTSIANKDARSGTSSSLPLIISAISLILTSAGAWYTYFKPAKIIVSMPVRISVAGDPFDNSTGMYVITIDHVFQNTGAKAGIVEELALIMHNKVNDQKMGLRTFLELPTREVTFLNDPNRLFSGATYKSHMVKPKENTAVSIVYRQIDLNRRITLLPGLYEFQIWFKEVGKKDFKKAGDVSIELTGHDVATINSITKTPQLDGRTLVNIKEQTLATKETDNLFNNFEAAI